MDTKQLSYDTPKTGASIVEKSSVQEHTHLTSSSNDCLEYALWWKERINLIVQTDKNLKVPCLDTISKIQGIFDKEILLIEREIENDFRHTLG